MEKRRPRTNAINLPNGRWADVCDPEQQGHQIRWAVITKTGRVVVEAETSDAAREKAERRGYFVLEVNRDNSSQATSF